MTGQQIIEALIARDEQVTEEFFFKNCRPLFMSIIRHVFPDKVDYSEFVNEFYLYLMENDAYRLRQFQGRSTIYQWMKVVAIRYFISRRDSMTGTGTVDSALSSSETEDTEKPESARLDINSLLESMTNRRYAYVIRRLVLDDAEPLVVAKEISTNVSNLYNIKKRAIASMTRFALTEIEKYEKEVIK